MVVGRRQTVLQGAKGIIGYNTGCSELYPIRSLCLFYIERGQNVAQSVSEMVVALLGGQGRL